MPKPDDMLEGQNVPENHGKPDTQDRVSKVEAVPTDREPASGYGPFDAGKAFFSACFA